MFPKRLTKRQRTRIITLLFSLLIAGLVWVGQEAGWIDKASETAQNTVQQTQPGLYNVIRFEDGDTITVNMNGVTERIRFIGVDTPETQDPRKPVQCFGKAAANFTKDLIGKQSVRLEADPLNTNRDRYNRLLRYVYLPDGRLVNAEIIKQGYGFAYLSFPFTKSDEFRLYQSQARTENQGLWGACEPTENEYGGFDANPEN